MPVLPGWIALGSCHILLQLCQPSIPRRNTGFAQYMKKVATTVTRVEAINRMAETSSMALDSIVLYCSRVASRLDQGARLRHHSEKAD